MFVCDLYAICRGWKRKRRQPIVAFVPAGFDAAQIPTEAKNSAAATPTTTCKTLRRISDLAASVCMRSFNATNRHPNAQLTRHKVRIDRFHLRAICCRSGSVMKPACCAAAAVLKLGHSLTSVQGLNQASVPTSWRHSGSESTRHKAAIKLDGAGVRLKIQFDAIPRRITKENLTLPDQRHIVNVMLNSMRTQSRGGGRKIRARECHVVEG